MSDFCAVSTRHRNCILELRTRTRSKHVLLKTVHVNLTSKNLASHRYRQRKGASELDFVFRVFILFSTSSKTNSKLHYFS